MSNIKKGIMLKLTSWENDGDNYKTVTLDGLDNNTALFYVEVAQLFKSGSNNGQATYGNTYESDEVNWLKLKNAVKTIVERYPSVDTDGYSFDFDNDDEDAIRDFISDLAYKVLGGSEYYIFRAFDGYKAYYVPADIEEIKLA